MKSSIVRHILSNKINIHEHIDKHGFFSVFLDIQKQLSYKKDIYYLNSLLNTYNEKKTHDITILTINPNISILNNISPIQYSNEDYFLQNVSIKYASQYIYLNNMNKIKNQEIKNKNEKTQIIYGQRNFNTFSFYVDKNNYNDNNILKLIQYDNNPVFVYYKNLPLNDITLKLFYTRIYKEKINNINEIIPKINEFQQELDNLYKNDYYKYYKFYYQKFYLEDVINISIKDLYNIQLFKNQFPYLFSIYIPSTYYKKYNFDFIHYY